MAINLTRQKLYDYLWSNGTTKTADKLNTTAEKVKAAALSANIPIPNNSYWSSLYMGKEVIKPALPDSNTASIVTIPEKKKRKPSLPSKDIDTHVETRAVAPKSKNNVSQDYFPDIQLTNSEVINKVLTHIKVPTTMPTHKNILIAQTIKQRHLREQSSRYDYAANKKEETIYFHGRDEISTSTEALIVTNTLLKAFTDAGAILKIVDQDVQVALDGALLILRCHIPSHRITLSPKDKRWHEWSDTAYVPDDDKIRFSIQVQHAWSHSSPVRHKANENNTDYVKRIFTKAIRLIPRSRKIAEQDRIDEINRKIERKREEERQEKHRKAYSELESLLDSAQAHHVAGELRAYLNDSNTIDTQELKRMLNLADWLEGGTENSILTESDRRQLISKFFKSHDDPFIF